MLLEISVDQKQLASIIFSFPITDPAINSSRFPQIFLPFATPSNSHLFALNLNILDLSSPLLVGRYSESPQPEKKKIVYRLVGSGHAGDKGEVDVTILAWKRVGPIVTDRTGQNRTEQYRRWR
ncbi:uncharacterized protein [Gossypium hirsutum]|uniref:Uncharacterized protein n=1 Tax=Gossypium hirsutum TaxID=3635 RepID=A0A1U8NCT4_GOSHI|nr:uncharacterized protein LOC107946855 [Gossypium hirsutum]